METLEISKRFKKEVERLGLKKVEVADKLNIARRTFHRIISGQTSVKAEYVSTFAEKYDADMVYIMTGIRENEETIMEEAKKISERLNEQIAQKNVNKSEMAKELNITRSTLYRMLNGESSIKAEHLAEIVEQYGIDYRYVMFGPVVQLPSLADEEEKKLLKIIDEMYTTWYRLQNCKWSSEGVKNSQIRSDKFIELMKEDLCERFPHIDEQVLWTFIEKQFWAKKASSSLHQFLTT